MKRYFVTNTLKNQFPTWFRSTNRRWVIVKYCQLVNENGSTEGIEDICIHSDFIHTDNYLDSYVMPTNEYNLEEKYEQLRIKDTFNIWFKDINGIQLPTKIIHDNITNSDIEILDGYKFILKLLLITE